MERLLNDEIAGQVREVFKQLSQPVQILLFTSQKNCQFCEDTRQLLEEVADLSDKITLKVYDLDKDKETAQQYRADKAPLLIVAAQDGDQVKDYGIRYAGIPSGHEFNTLIQDLILVSGRDSNLKPATRDFLKGLKSPLSLQVFITPT